MQPHTGFITSVHAPDDDVFAECARRINQRQYDQPSNTSPAVIRRHVDRELDCILVADLFPELAQRAPADDCSCFIYRDQYRQPQVFMLFNPAGALVERARSVIPGAGRIEHPVIVDVKYSRALTRFATAHPATPAPSLTSFTST